MIRTDWTLREMAREALMDAGFVLGRSFTTATIDFRLTLPKKRWATLRRSAGEARARSVNMSVIAVKALRSVLFRLMFSMKRFTYDQPKAPCVNEAKMCSAMLCSRAALSPL